MSGRSLVFFILTVGVAKALPASGAAALDAFVEPPSVEDVLTIGGVRVDGSLNLGYDLGEWALGTPQRIAFRLVHRVRTTAFGEPISEMNVVGLTAFAAPAGRLITHVSLLGGGEATFRSDAIGEKFALVSPGLAAMQDPAGHLEIASSGGWLSVFDHGLLVGGAGPTLLRFEVESQGAKVTRALAKRFGGVISELTARYDSLGRMKELRFSSQRHRFDYSGPQGQMSEWTATAEGKPTKTRFEYKDGLLAKVIRDGKVQLNLEFEPVPGGLTADTEWPASVRVAHAGSWTYSYVLDQKGYHVTAVDDRSHATERRILNPKLGTIDLIEGGRREKRLFFGVDRGQPDTGKITRIEENGGDTLEYEYNDLGQLSAFRRRTGRSASEVKFTYDQAGRREPSGKQTAQ